MRREGLGSREVAGWRLSRAALPVALGLLILGVARFTADAQQPTSGRVTVRIVSSISGEPLPQIEVWLLRRRQVDPNAMAITGNRYEATPLRSLTDATGEALFASVPPGTYGVQVNRFELTPRTLDDFEVKDAGIVRQELRAIPHAVVEGTVLDDRGLPIPRAFVELMKYRIANTNRPGLVAVSSGRTDARGQYRIESREPGGFYLRASVPELRFRGAVAPAVYYPNTREPEKAQRVVIESGKQLKGIDLRLENSPFLHIRGHVQGFEGKALRIWAWRYRLDSPEPQEGIESQLLPDGNFDIAGIAPGHYYVTAESASLDDPAHYVFGAKQIDVQQSDVDNVLVQVSSPAELRGVIRTEAGLPMPRSVELESWGPPFNFTANTRATVDAASGAFVLQNVFGREYSLRIEGSREAYVKSAHLGLRDVTGQIFTPLDSSDRLTLEVAAGQGVLTGNVEPRSAASKETYVMLVPAARMLHRRDLLREVRVQPDGSFRFNALPPGEYKILAWQTYDPYSMQAPEFLALFPGQPIEMKGGEPLVRSVVLISDEEIAEAKAKF